MFFDPRLGELRGVLRNGDWRRPAEEDRPIELLVATLPPGGDVALEVRFTASGKTEQIPGLMGTREDDDGRLALEMRGGRFLVFDSEFQARVRDVVLSLANRSTPYF